MKVKLAVAFAVLAFATTARADSLTDANGTIIYPSGSTITSESYQNTSYWGETGITFEFADGTGTVSNLIPEGMGESGSVNFTTPVTDLSVVWTSNYLNAQGPNGEIGFVYCLTTCTTEFDGPVSELTWEAGYFDGASITPGDGPEGISSLTYATAATDPPSVPEPSSLLLLVVGLAVLMHMSLS